MCSPKLVDVDDAGERPFEVVDRNQLVFIEMDHVEAGRLVGAVLVILALGPLEVRHDRQQPEVFPGKDVEEQQLLRVCGRQEGAVGVDAQRFVAGEAEVPGVQVDVILLDAFLVEDGDEPAGVDVGGALKQAEIVGLGHEHLVVGMVCIWRQRLSSRPLKSKSTSDSTHTSSEKNFSAILAPNGNSKVAS